MCNCESCVNIMDSMEGAECNVVTEIECSAEITTIIRTNNGLSFFCSKHALTQIAFKDFWEDE